MRMTAFLMSGRVIDLILLLVVAEAAGLLLLRRATGRGVAPSALLANLAAGAFLLLALRCGLSGAGAAWVGLCLALALVAHLADLRSRWYA
jgi:hypothetical protein